MIRGERVHLRTIRSGDLEKFLDLTSEIASRGVYYPLNLTTESALREEFNRSGMWESDYGTLLIFHSGEKRLVGQITFFKTVRYYKGFEIGYQIFDPKDHGKGLATEATSLFCKYLFDSKSILRLTIQVEPGNIGSRKVAEKCGFKFEGVARSAFESHGKVTDIEVWSLVHSDVYRAK